MGNRLALQGRSASLTLAGLQFCKLALPGRTAIVRLASLRQRGGGERLTRPRLLIADQNHIIRQTLADLLQEHCDIVGTVANGKGLLAELEAADPNVILLGVALEETTGFEVARCLRQSACQAKIIIVSLHESRDLVRAALAMGISGYVFMSRVLDDLPAAIEAVCRGETFEPALARDASAD